MTTRVKVTNENQLPYAEWDVELVGPDGHVLHRLKPGESVSESLWHDGRALQVREVPLPPKEAA